MVKDRNLVSIDVGTTKICTMLARLTDKGKVQVLGVGVSPVRGFRSGICVEIRDAKEAFRDSIRQVETTSDAKVTFATVGISGHHVTSFNNRGTLAIAREDRLVTPEDLRLVLTSATSVKIPSDTRLLHVIPRSYIVDGQKEVNNPVGMHGFRLDVETNIIVAAVASVQNLVKCIRGIGIEVEDLVLEPLAIAAAVLTEEEKQNGVLMADIGGDITNIAIFKDSSLYHASVLPIAGSHITRDISIGLGLPFVLAEAMKKKYGTVTALEDKNEADRIVTIDSHSVYCRDLSEIIRIRVEELLRLILLELPRTDYAKLVPSGLVLTGGTANLRGIVELGKEVIGLPVRVGIPSNIYGSADSLRDPAYAAAIGLLLWSLEHVPEDNMPLIRRWYKRIAKPRSTRRAKRTKPQLDENIRDFESAREFFEHNKADILSKYRDRYVAILGNKILDSDESFDRLAERVYDKFGYRPVYMPRVVAESPIVYLPSPKIQPGGISK